MGVKKVILSRWKEILSYFQNIKNRLKVRWSDLKPKIKKSNLVKYIFGSLIYIVVSGFLINCFTFAFFNTQFNLISMIGSGYIIFFIRYELVELIRDVRKRR